ncbi:MAG: DUF86 domain-containing protein [Chitinispirillales bacterium]|jgi:uncharacterized protein with HEPN domain|nr:DUF86 domain-containing protein [Chitinispirillales bacterium]
MLKERDRDILEHIVEYCDEVRQAIVMFDDSLKSLKTNATYKNAVSMCVLQIGELVTHFSKEFLAANPKVPWADIKRMRNIAAHHYKKFSLEKLHGTMVKDIPKLKEYCLELLAQK